MTPRHRRAARRTTVQLTPPHIRASLSTPDSVDLRRPHEHTPHSRRPSSPRHDATRSDAGADLRTGGLRRSRVPHGRALPGRTLDGCRRIPRGSGPLDHGHHGWRDVAQHRQRSELGQHLRRVLRGVDRRGGRRHDGGASRYTRETKTFCTSRHSGMHSERTPNAASSAPPTEATRGSTYWRSTTRPARPTSR
jgi:hypothetical protein